MRAVDVLATPWPPYAVTFSRDGHRIAIGGGTWYGDGGLVLVRLDSREAAVWRCADLLPAASSALGVPTVSSLCLSDDDRLLAASMWSARQHNAPTVLFEVDGLDVRCQRRFAHILPRFHDPCPTGVLLYGSSLITRLHSVFGSRLTQIACEEAVPDPDDVLSIRDVPDGARVAADPALQQLTHHRLIVSRGCVITETGGSRGTYTPDERGEFVKVPVREGLVLRPLDGAPDTFIAVQGCGRISAICGLEPDRRFVTGGLNGELDSWTWEDGWRQRRLQDARPDPRKDWGTLKNRMVWVTYRPTSIVALAAVPRSTRWLSVSAGGEIALWCGDELERVWQLPVPGTPRALAVHPAGHLAAVGIKQGSFGQPESSVLLLEIG